MHRTRHLFLTTPLFLIMILLRSVLPAQAVEAKKVVLCTTFPVYQITRNIVRNRSGMEVQLLLPAMLGCPHDYALTPQDMEKLAKADILVINGLGLEEFLGTPVTKANPKIQIIDSSVGIEEILQYTREEDKSTDRHDTGINPHIFTSPRISAIMAMNIADELARIDPAGTTTYIGNGRAYTEKMNCLSEEFELLGKRLLNKRIVTEHSIFDYLARDIGLDVVAVIQSHPGQEPSAAEMIDIVKTIREKQAGAVFTEPQYPSQVGRTIAREAGVPVETLDPAAAGPENAPIDYYERVLLQDIDVLEKALGRK